MVVVQLPLSSRNLGHRRHSCMGRTKPIVRSRMVQPDALPERSSRHVRMTNRLAVCHATCFHRRVVFSALPSRRGGGPRTIRSDVP